MHDDEMLRIVLALQAEVSSLKRMVAGQLRFGRIREVDHEEKKARLLLSTADGREFLSPWRPWAEIAGEEKSWRPPTQGQQVMLVAPHGDMRSGVILPMTYSDARPAPSSDAGTRVISTFGGASLLFDGNGDRAELSAGRVDLGSAGGRSVARVGDKVLIQTGSSAGLWPIVEGSNSVFAGD